MTSRKAICPSTVQVIRTITTYTVCLSNARKDGRNRRHVVDETYEKWGQALLLLEPQV